MAVVFLWSALLVLPIKETPPIAGAAGYLSLREFLFAGFGVTWRARPATAHRCSVRPGR